MAEPTRPPVRAAEQAANADEEESPDESGWDVRALILGGLALIVIVLVLIAFATRGSSPSQPQPLPYLGVSLVSLPGAPNNAVLIKAVTPGSPADGAGLGAGDLLDAVNGHTVTSPGGVDSVLSGLHAGDTVTLQIQRGRRMLQASVQLIPPPTGVP